MELPLERNKIIDDEVEASSKTSSFLVVFARHSEKATFTVDGISVFYDDVFTEILNS